MTRDLRLPAAIVALVAVASGCSGKGVEAVPAVPSSSSSASSAVSPSASLPCTKEEVKDAPRLTFEKAKTLIGTLPWYCDIDTETGRIEAGRPHDTSTTTEVWMRAISTDVPLPKGFDEDTTTAAYVDVGGQWYRIRQAGIGHTAPLKISSSPTHS